jgi:holo-[acyl-carrier protein] synthase
VIAPHGLMVVSHGIDLVEVRRIARLLDQHRERFLEKCFTPRESAYARGTKRYAEHLAARFAAKEAALKAIGTGWRDGIAWTDVEVTIDPAGAPHLSVTGLAAHFATELGITDWLVSLTHTTDLAQASVIACRRA